VIDGVAKVGGGALPLLELPGPVVALHGSAEALAVRLRANDPPCPRLDLRLVQNLDLLMRYEAFEQLVPDRS